MQLKKHEQGEKRWDTAETPKGVLSAELCPSRSVRQRRTNLKVLIPSSKARKTPERVFFLLWRKGWDSNPCADKSTTAFRVRLVMTTSIPFRLNIKLYVFEVGEMRFTTAKTALLSLRRAYARVTGTFTTTSIPFRKNIKLYVFEVGEMRFTTAKTALLSLRRAYARVTGTFNHFDTFPYF